MKSPTPDSAEAVNVRGLTFGQRLRMARRAAGLSIEDAAYIFKRSPRQWKYWEADERTPPAEADVLTQERLLAAMDKAQTVFKSSDKPR